MTQPAWRLGSLAVAILLGTTFAFPTVAEAQCSPPQDLLEAPTLLPGGAGGIASADLNGDGLPDLVCGTGGDSILVRLSLGHRVFASPVSYPAGPDARAVAVSDLDDDGIADLVVTNTHGASASLFRGRGNAGAGDGTFEPLSTLPVQFWPSCVRVADFDADGHPDIFVTNQGARTVSVLRGLGSGNFEPARNLPVGREPAKLILADLDRNGLLDIVVANSYGPDLTILRANATLGAWDGSFAIDSCGDFSTGSTDVVPFDMNGDGVLDLISCGYYGDLKFFIGPQFTEGRLYFAPHADALRSVDMNNDGYMDLVSCAIGYPNLNITLGKPYTYLDPFCCYVSFPTYGGMDLTIADFDHDGAEDIAWVNMPVSTTTRIMYGTCNGGPYKLITKVQGDGQVTVEPNLVSYPAGQQVMATAVTDTLHAVRWLTGGTYSSPNPIAFTMAGQRTLTAIFDYLPYTSAIFIDGQGTVARSPDRTRYQYGEGVVLTASPAPGWRFGEWSGAAVGTYYTASFYVYSNWTVTAHFAADGRYVAAIDSVRDVPGDQGGWLVCRFRGAGLDLPAGDPLRAISDYVIRRGAGDDSVADVPADGLTEYAISVPTDADSTSAGTALVEVCIEARSLDRSQSWRSAPATGYSVDNLAPSAPAGLVIANVGGVVTITWAHNEEPDVEKYEVYRGDTAAFVPSTQNLIAQVTDTTYAEEASASSWYGVIAVDRHGNRGPVAEKTFAPIAGVSWVTSNQLKVVGAVPQPSRGPLAIRFELPRPSRVSLSLYDLGGRKLWTAHRDTYEAGTHDLVWNGCDAGGSSVPAGIYFLRLDACGTTLSRRVAIVH